MIRLVDLYDSEGRPLESAIAFLYELMKQRPAEANISHKGLPSWEEHVQFVSRIPRPYRFWYLIHRIPTAEPEEPVGYVSATENNEIGIVLLERFRSRGFGPMALRMFIANHHPITTHRHPTWLANISPANEHSKHVFEKVGFTKLQETYQLKEEHGSKT